MRRFIHILIFALMPLMAFSQYDKKYLEGAVTLTDGKIVFNREVVANGLSASQVYNAINEWAAVNYSGENGQIISSDSQTKRLTARGLQKAQVRVGLFPSKVHINYFLVAECKDNGCSLSFVRFVYTNNPSSDNPNEKIAAEDYIIDKYALNKTATKLTGGPGDYRRVTIDLVDETTAQIQSALANYLVNLNNNGTPTANPPIASGSATAAAATISVEQSAATASVATTAASTTATTAVVAPPAASSVEVAVATAVESQNLTKTDIAMGALTPKISLEGFTNIAPEKIPGNIIKIVKDNGIFLSAANGTTFEREIAGEGGLGVYQSESVIYFSCKELSQVIGTDCKSLTFSFKNEVFRNATVELERWMVITATPVLIAGDLVVAQIKQISIK